MTWYNGLITFTIAWWIFLFMVLPFGVRPDDHPLPGTVESAPAKPRLLLKFAITTVLAALATGAVAWIVELHIIDFRPAPVGAAPSGTAVPSPARA
jgi:predicted secreted protein